MRHYFDFGLALGFVSFNLTKNFIVNCRITAWAKCCNGFKQTIKNIICRSPKRKSSWFRVGSILIKLHRKIIRHHLYFCFKKILSHLVSYSKRSQFLLSVTRRISVPSKHLFMTSLIEVDSACSTYPTRPASSTSSISFPPIESGYQFVWANEE